MPLNDTPETSTSSALAHELLDIGAVLLAPDDPFTWSSGLHAPIYCDNRLTLAHPALRQRIARAFAQLIDNRDLAPEVVVGTATAGIPHAAWLADQLALPMAYVRSRPKAHGRGNQIEGIVERGQRVVVVEDLVSTGGSSARVVEALRAAGAEVAAVLAIFSYGLEGAACRFAQLRLPLYTLTDFGALLAAAAEQGALEPEAVKSLRSWQQDPQHWSEHRARR